MQHIAKTNINQTTHFLSVYICLILYRIFKFSTLYKTTEISQ